MPGAGKSTGIQAFTIHCPEILVFDIADHKPPFANTQLQTIIRECNSDCIAESVCGISVPHTLNIFLDTSIEQCMKNLASRNEKLDHEYLYLLRREIGPAQYIINNSEDLTSLLLQLYRG